MTQDHQDGDWLFLSIEAAFPGRPYLSNKKAGYPWLPETAPNNPPV
jgi:hypothetical protein